MWISDSWQDFEVLDCSRGEKLERWGKYTLVRPDPQAIWDTPRTDPRWRTADGRYSRSHTGGGSWDKRTLPPSWDIRYRDLTFRVKPMNFKHTGIFPEQAANWDYAMAKIRAAGRPISVLNLFGYTGVASLVMAAKGARVTHVDASKKAVGAAVENQKLSGLGDAPIRWIIDDALKFVEREVRRGRRYAGIILDPPKYGRGPKGEVWELDEKLAALMSACAALLDDRSKFLVLTAYAVRLSAIAIANLTEEVTRPLGGSVQAGEMTIREEARGLLLPTAIFARWSR